MNDYFTFGIEYFDPDSSGSQFDTVSADCVKHAVEQFKADKPFAKVYNVFVQHRDAEDYIDEEFTK
jgi:hypothetical protein